MRLVKIITTAFIDVFGITHPTPAEERRAAWFICGSLAVIFAGMISLLVILFVRAHH